MEGSRWLLMESAMDCPSNVCRAATSRVLTIGEVNRITPQNWLSTAEICTTCRCVHSNGIVRGHLDSELLGQGWVPAH